jgi:hypothetical protein
MGKILGVNEIFSPLYRGLCVFMQIQQVGYSLVSLEVILINSASCACALPEYYILQTVGGEPLCGHPWYKLLRSTTALQYKFGVRLMNTSLHASTNILTPLCISISTVDISELCSVCVGK